MSIATELGMRIAAMRYESLPPEAVHWAKVSIIDTIGCALAGAYEDCAQIAQRVIAAPGASGPSLIWGSDRRVAPLHAAVVNGTAAHALDYDDIGTSLAGHPSPDRMEARFQDYATRTLRPSTVAGVLGMLKQLESVANVREVSTLMAASVASSPAARAAA